MAETAQKLITLASTIVENCLADGGGGSSAPKMGAKNQVYYAKLNAECPPSLMPMLTTMVNGALKSKTSLIKVAKEDGLFDLPPSSLPPGCPALHASHPPPELLVVLYEALYGSRRVRGTSPIVRLVKSRKASLQKTLASRRKQGVEHKFTARTKLPRFVRVNHMKTNVELAKRHFQRTRGLVYQPPPHFPPPDGSSSSSSRSRLANSTSNVLTSLPKGKFTIDPVLPDLFILPAGTNLHTDAQVDGGALVLQDRSSCMTAIALSPPPDAICIDTCASPGNKTLHMASLMMRGADSKSGGGKVVATGKITAFERDPTRLGTLQRRIVEQGADEFVSARGADFMDVDVSSPDGEFNDVTHVLIDPSCSGSGLAATSENGATLADEYDRPNSNGDGLQDTTTTSRLAAAGNTSDSEKVAQLARAQIELILHAMKLPSLKVVAYSTCSVFREENEDVVLAVLARQSEFICVEAIPNWPHRGLEGLPEFKAIAPLVCRATYEKDSTNGFFVARFERISTTCTNDVTAAGEDDGNSHGKKMKRKKKRKKREDEALASSKEPQGGDLAKMASSSSSPTKRPKVPIPVVEERLQETVVKPKKEPCKQFAKRGTCKRGNKCRFSHESDVVALKDDVDALMEEWT